MVQFVRQHLTTMTSPLRIAMWSGPRNISTALMRAWENRADTTVVDEPFYAFYLQATGKQHPLTGDIIAAGETDWRKVAVRLTSAGEDGSQIIYQKQMTHHLLPEVERSWLSNLTNCFLIRDPAEVIVSYLKKNGEPTLEDLGFIQQAALFDCVRAQSNMHAADRGRPRRSAGPGAHPATAVYRGRRRV